MRLDVQRSAAVVALILALAPGADAYPVPFTELSSGTQAPAALPSGAYVLRSQADLGRYGLEALVPPGRIDWSQELMVALASDTKPTHGYSIEVASARRTSYQGRPVILVRYGEVAPQPGVPLAAAQTRPYQLVKLRRGGELVLEPVDPAGTSPQPSPAPAPAPPGDGSLPFSILASGPQADATLPAGTSVVHSLADLRRYGIQPSGIWTQIDWDDEMALILVGDTKRTLGHSIGVESIKLEVETPPTGAAGVRIVAVVRYRERAPRPGTILAPALSRPYQVVKLARRGGAVEFRRVGAELAPERLSGRVSVKGKEVAVGGERVIPASFAARLRSLNGLIVTLEGQSHGSSFAGERVLSPQMRRAAGTVATRPGSQGVVLQRRGAPNLPPLELEGPLTRLLPVGEEIGLRGWLDDQVSPARLHVVALLARAKGHSVLLPLGRVRPGELIEVSAGRAGFWQVTTPQGSSGWMRRENAELISPPARAAAVRGAAGALRGAPPVRGAAPRATGSASTSAAASAGATSAAASAPALPASGAKGTIVLRVYRQAYQDGGLIKRPYSGVGVFLDGNSPRGGPPADGHTSGGVVSFELEAGPHTVSFSQMTSSHSVFYSPTFSFTVEAGQRREQEIVLQPASTRIVANTATRPGEALFVTGATDLLGNWRTAYRLTPGPDGWSYTGKLPLGLRYKLLRGPWIAGDTTPIHGGLTWERGSNRAVRSELDWQPNRVSPAFD